MSRCYTLPLTSSACSPASGAKAGGYFDNLSIGFFAQQPATLAINFGTNLNDWYNSLASWVTRRSNSVPTT